MMSKHLKELRIAIAELDKKLITILKKRQDYSREIAKLKLNLKLPIHDISQEAKQFTNYKKLAIEYDLNLEFINKLFTAIIAESRRIQQHNND